MLHHKFAGMNSVHSIQFDCFSLLISSGQVNILHCNYCRRRIGLWNYKHSVETNGTDMNQHSEEINQNGTESGQSDEECGEPRRKRVKIVSYENYVFH